MGRAREENEAHLKEWAIMYLGYRYNSLSEPERDRICQENLMALEADFATVSGNCMYCTYPVALSGDVGVFSHFAQGRICCLCSELEQSVNTQFFREAHAQYMHEVVRKRKMMEGNNFP